MLKPAKLYEAELNRLFCESVLDKRFKWLHLSFPETQFTADDTFWSKIQLVSVNSDNEVIGFFEAGIDRPENFIKNLRCAHFSPELNTMTFAKDLQRFIKYLAEDKRFPKIKWCVIVGNPIESKYDQIVAKYGGRIIGVHKYDVLIDGKYYDRKQYEWINHYWECINCGHTENRKGNLFCSKCNIGEMVCRNPLEKP